MHRKYFLVLRMAHLLEDEGLVGALSHQVIVLETNVTPFGGIRNRARAGDVPFDITVKTPDREFVVIYD